MMISWVVYDWKYIDIKVSMSVLLIWTIYNNTPRYAKLEKLNNTINTKQISKFRK